MADVGFRDLIGSIAPGRRAEPTVAPLREAPTIERETATPVVVTPPPPRAAALFGPDAQPADALGLEPTFAHLAEMALHRRTGTPLVVGVLGAPGGGKSFALGRILSRVRALAKAADGLAATPFVSRVHTVTLDSAALGEGDPAVALAAALHASLRGPYPDLAREIGHLASDPHATLRQSNDKLDEARRRLDAERRALDDAGSRRARLIETVLYETSGSAVDAYARANRAGLQRRFTGFGLGGDAVRTYKDFVLTATGSGGRLSLALRSLWAFKGQTKLIVVAILLVALGVGLGIAIETQDTWLGDPRNGPQAGVGLAGWLQAHIGLIGTARTAAYALAVLCLVANVWRASAFLRPIFRGATLLGGDLDGRRRDLDGLYAHQTKRVDALDADVERLTREVSEAERRTGGRAEPSPFAASEAGAADAMFAALQAHASREPQKGPAAPQRLVIALDDLDRLAPERGRALLDVLRRNVGRGAVVLVALDPATAAADDLARWVDVPLRLPGLASHAAFVARSLGTAVPAAVPAPPDASRSAFDAPIDAGEAEMLASVAPLAGGTPRAARRFLDLYRLARTEGDAPAGALALAVALSVNESRSALRRALVARGAAGLDELDDGPLRDALKAVAQHDGATDDGTVRAAARQAERYALVA